MNIIFQGNIVHKHVILPFNVDKLLSYFLGFLQRQNVGIINKVRFQPSIYHFEEKKSVVNHFQFEEGT